MDEMKKQPQQGEQKQDGQGGQGGRRRRHNRHRGGHKSHAQGQNQAQNQGQNQNAEKPAQATQQKPAQQKPAQKQAAKQQPVEKQQPQTQKHKQKPPMKQAAQSQAQPQAQLQSAQAANQNKKKKLKQGGGNTNASQEENRKDTYLYTLDGNLYVNLTNKCSNGCDFCVRNERTSYYGNYLWLKKGEPTADKVIAQANGFGDLTKFKEVVFCGFGEPTYRMAEMVALCDFFHEKGLRTRLNTNGQGSLINKRDIVPELKGKIDFVNISLNASCAEKYQKICRSQFREAGFDGMIEFAKTCRRNGVDCRFSIVDCIGEEEVEACKRLAASVNVPLYIRDYITDS